MWNFSKKIVFFDFSCEGGDYVYAAVYIPLIKTTAPQRLDLVLGRLMMQKSLLTLTWG